MSSARRLSSAGCALIVGAELMACASSRTRACVAEHLDELSWIGHELVCDRGWHPRRTGDPCGPDYEHVVLVGCHWVGKNEDADPETVEVEIFMPRDRNICDVQTQGGGLCFH